MYNTFLFDLDGVIFDTEPLYTAFWNKMGQQLLPHISDVAHLIKGQTLTEIFDRFFPDSQTQSFLIEKIDELESKMTFAYIPGFEQFITALNQLDVHTAIVTSSNLPKMHNVHRCHPELSKWFDEILTSEDFARSKPHPDCYLTAASRFGATVDKCVVFEDSKNGLLAGRNAQMTVCGLATTLSANIISSYADIVINDFSDLTVNRLFDLLSPPK